MKDGRIQRFLTKIKLHILRRTWTYWVRVVHSLSRTLLASKFFLMVLYVSTKRRCNRLLMKGWAFWKQFMKLQRIQIWMNRILYQKHKLKCFQYFQQWKFQTALQKHSNRAESAALARLRNLEEVHYKDVLGTKVSVMDRHYNAILKKRFAKAFQVWKLFSASHREEGDFDAVLQKCSSRLLRAWFHRPLDLERERDIWN
jgi:hypothetical protein